MDGYKITNDLNNRKNQRSIEKQKATPWFNKCGFP